MKDGSVTQGKFDHIKFCLLYNLEKWNGEVIRGWSKLDSTFVPYLLPFSKIQDTWDHFKCLISSCLRSLLKMVMQLKNKVKSTKICLKSDLVEE